MRFLTGYFCKTCQHLWKHFNFCPACTPKKIKQLASFVFSTPSKIEVKAEWDAEAKVWVATSDNVPGLVTEADTIELLQQKLLVMIPELLEANGANERA